MVSPNKTSSSSELLPGTALPKSAMASSPNTSAVVKATPAKDLLKTQFDYMWEHSGAMPEHVPSVVNKGVVKLSSSEINALTHLEHYPEVDPVSITDEIRGRDGLDLGLDPKVRKDFFRKNDACIVIDGRMDRPFGNVRSVSQKEKTTASRVKVNWHLSTQLPCVEIHIERMVRDENSQPVKHTVVRRIFGMSLFPQNDDGTVCWMSGMTGTAFDQGDFPERIRSANTVNNLTEFGLFQGSERDFGGNSNRATWTNIAYEELMRLKRMAPAQLAQCDEMDQFIVHLETSRGIQIFQEWSVEKREAAFVYLQAMQVLLDTSFTYGSFWFLKANQVLDRFARVGDIDDTRYDLNLPFPVAKWLVKSYKKVEVDSFADLIFVPDTWAEYETIRTGAPAEDMVIFHTLGAIRESFHEGSRLRDYFSGNTELYTLVQHHPDPDEKGMYVLQFWLEPSSDSPNSIPPVPPVNATGQITIHKSSYRAYTFKFRVVDNPFRSTATFAMFTEGGPEIEGLRNKDMFVVKTIRFNSTKEELKASVGGMLRMLQGQEEPRGVDIPHLILGANPTVHGEHKDGLIREAWKRADSETQAYIRRLQDKLPYNDSQRKVLARITTSATNITHGAAGSGKTELLVWCIWILVVLGIQVHIVAPTNVAVENVFSRYRTFVAKQRERKNNRFLLVRSGHRERIANGDMARLLANWRREAEVDTTDPYHDNTLSAYIKSAATRWASQKASSTAGMEVDAHPLCAEAARWLEIQAILEFKPDKHTQGKTVISKKYDKRALRKEAEDLHTILARLVFMHGEERPLAVFSTPGAAENRVIVDNYHAEAMAVDEAGFVKPFDIAPICARYMGNLKSISIVGDHMQLRPVALSKDRNEAFSAQSISLLESLVLHRKGEFDYAYLNRQYRMHPDIQALPSARIYGKHGFHIDSAPSTKNTLWVKEMATFAAVLLGDKWNGHHRIFIDAGVDLDGQPALSRKDDGSTSSHNPFEAQVVQALTFLVRQFALKSKTLKVTPTSIMQTSPYTLQVQKFRSGFKRMLENAAVLADHGIDLMYQQDVHAKTVAQSQGDECEVSISSMTVNRTNHADVGFVSNQPQLLVQLTRPKSMLFMVGNWKNWIANLKHMSKASTRDEFFRDLLKDIEAKKDVYSLADCEFLVEAMNRISTAETKFRGQGIQSQPNKPQKAWQPTPKPAIAGPSSARSLPTPKPAPNPPAGSVLRTPAQNAAFLNSVRERKKAEIRQRRLAAEASSSTTTTATNVEEEASEEQQPKRRKLAEAGDMEVDEVPEVKSAGMEVDEVPPAQEGLEMPALQTTLQDLAHPSSAQLVEEAAQYELPASPTASEEDLGASKYADAEAWTEVHPRRGRSSRARGDGRGRGRGEGTERGRGRGKGRAEPMEE